MHFSITNKHALSIVIRIALVIAVLAGAVTIMATTKPLFTTREKAYYLSTSDALFIRPGIVVKLTNAQIANDGTITAQFTLTDPAGLPLDMNGMTTPGSIEVGLVAAVLPNNQSQYTAYTTTLKTANGVTAIQAGYDKGGTFTLNAPGQYTYTFATRAPTGFDATATHSIGIYAERDLSEFGLGVPGADDVYTFVPSGSTVTHVRNIVVSATCDNCHDRLSAHGGSRTKIEMCDLCHTPQTINPDTGNSMDLPVMIHKIHMGSSLPSVKAGGKYTIVHMGSTHDFSDVVYPADARRCQTCHDPKNGAQQTDAWLKNPSRAACGACHDDVNFATGQNHLNLPQVDDNQCAGCHAPKGEIPFDTSILGAHVVPSDTTASYPQNPDPLITGDKITITGVTNTSAGQAPIVAFTVKDVNGNPLQISALEDLSFTMAGPTSDYGYTSFGSDVTTPGYVTEDGTAATCDASSNCLYTFHHTIPAKATGTYAIAAESERLETVLAGTTAQQTVESGTANQVVYFSVDGSPLVPRRSVVAKANCNQCHASLQGHGARRNDPEYCVLCHNPSLTDASTRATSKNPADLAQPPQALNFTLMVHRIHTGSNLAAMGATYVEVSHNGKRVDFSDVRYSAMNLLTGAVGETRDCGVCHVNGSEQNFPTGLNKVTDPQGLINPAPPVTSACMGCHVTVATAAHASTTTDGKFGESCEVCHGASADFNVGNVHAQ